MEPQSCQPANEPPASSIPSLDPWLRRPGLLVAAGFALLLLGVAGCAGLPFGTRDEGPPGKLEILGSPDETYVRGIAKAFEIETGVKTTYVRESSGDALETLRASRDAPQFSVWWGGPIDLYIEAAADGLLVPHKPRGFSVIPSQFKDAEGSWTGVYVGALALAVNTRVLAEKGLPEPASWADLAKPVYRGQISMAHPATSGTAYTALATIVQLHRRDVEQAFAYLQALHRNVMEYRRAGADPARIVGRGEAAIGIVFSHDIVAAYDEGFEDLKVIFPAEGTGYEIGGMALVRNAPDPETGKRFMDWAIGAKAQELGPLFRAYQIPTNPDAKVARRSIRLSEVRTIDYDFSWSGANRQALVERFSGTIAPPPR